MDPISALQVASSAAQFIGVGIELCKRLNEVRETGETTKDNLELEQVIRRLEQVHLAASSSPASQATDPTQRNQSGRLVDIDDTLEAYREASESLSKLLTAIKAQKQGRRGAVKAAVLSLFHKGDVQKLETALRKRQSEFDTVILVQVKQLLESATLRDSLRLQELDDNLRDVARKLVEGQISVAQLLGIVHDQHDRVHSNIEHVKRRLEHQDEQLIKRQRATETQTYRQMLIQSLSFPGIWDRQENIVSAYRGTCGWILHPDLYTRVRQARSRSASQESANDFSRWLASDERFFWICGVAGSGKSTLTSYIANHEDDVRLRLSKWSGDSETLILSFFFWRHGNFLQQKSINGLLRTLLLQIVQRPSLAQDVLQACEKHYIPSADRPWPNEQLKNLFVKIIRSLPTKTCIFIDALDEFHGYFGEHDAHHHDRALRESIDDLFELIYELRELPSVKLCVSSRPGNAFTAAFEKDAVLDLSKLNDQDISNFVTGRLSRVLTSGDRDSELLARTIIRGSRGIFLWAKLAVDSVLRGYSDGDNMNELCDRLAALPPGLEAMYDHMLRRIEPHRLEEAIMLFKLVETVESPTRTRDELRFLPVPNGLMLLLSLELFSSTGSLLQRQLEFVPKGNPITTEITLKKLVDARGSGLLEIERRSDFSHIRTRKLSLHHSNDVVLPEPWIRLLELDVRFIHRTAVEYMGTWVEGLQSGLGYRSSSATERLTMLSIGGRINYLKQIFAIGSDRLQSMDTITLNVTVSGEYSGTSGVVPSLIYRSLLGLVRSNLSRVSISTSDFLLDQIGLVSPLLEARTCAVSEGMVKAGDPACLSGRQPLIHLIQCAIYGFIDYAKRRLIHFLEVEPITNPTYALGIALDSLYTPGEYSSTIFDRSLPWLPDLVEILLNHGAQPSKAFLEMVSPWQTLLADLARCIRRLAWRLTADSVDPDTQRGTTYGLAAYRLALGRACESLVGSGADAALETTYDLPTINERERGILDVTVSSTAAVILHLPAFLDDDLNDGRISPGNLHSIRTQNGRLLRRSEDWPMKLSIISCTLTLWPRRRGRIEIEIKTSEEQSRFILEDIGNPHHVRSRPQARHLPFLTKTQRARLAWVMLFEFARQSARRREETNGARLRSVLGDIQAFFRVSDEQLVLFAYRGDSDGLNSPVTSAYSFGYAVAKRCYGMVQNDKLGWRESICPPEGLRKGRAWPHSGQR